MRQITEIVVHCTATQAGTPFRAADIDRWHRARGFDSIGYHFAIPLDGSIEQGRPVQDIGAHALRHNAHSVGVCLVGGIAVDGRPACTFNDAQFDALELLLRGLLHRWPAARVVGHCDLPGVTKVCPCFDVHPWCVSRGLTPAV